MPRDNDLIVVHCPGAVHKEPAVESGVSRSATPKILFAFKRGMSGHIVVQCSEGRCKHSAGPRFNGWHEVTVRADGSYTIEVLPKQHFALLKLPGVVLEGAT
jgi:hypothetical protein